MRRYSCEGSSDLEPTSAVEVSACGLSVACFVVNRSSRACKRRSCGGRLNGMEMHVLALPLLSVLSIVVSGRAATEHLRAQEQRLCKSATQAAAASRLQVSCCNSTVGFGPSPAEADLYTCSLNVNLHRHISETRAAGLKSCSVKLLQAK